MNPPEKWMPVRCIPMISQSMWDKAQELLKRNKELPKKNNTRDYLLSGKIFCSQCGSPYVGYVQPKWKVVDGVKKRWGENQNYRYHKNNKEKSAEPCHTARFPRSCWRTGCGRRSKNCWTTRRRTSRKCSSRNART